jgi:hypothetical protein
MINHDVYSFFKKYSLIILIPLTLKHNYIKSFIDSHFHYHFISLASCRKAKLILNADFF